jgi:hypothetical protein
MDYKSNKTKGVLPMRNEFHSQYSYGGNVVPFAVGATAMRKRELFMAWLEQASCDNSVIQVGYNRTMNEFRNGALYEGRRFGEFQVFHAVYGVQTCIFVVHDATLTAYLVYDVSTPEQIEEWAADVGLIDSNMAMSA